MRKLDDNVDMVAKNLEAKDDLGKEVLRQFRQALFVKQTTTIGDHCLEDLLHECYKARDNTTTPNERALREQYPQWATMPVSLVAFKVGILVPLLRESLIDTVSAPFTTDPTPNPDIPEAKRHEIIDTIASEVLNLAQIGSLEPSTLEQTIRGQKVEALRQIKNHAKEQAKQLEQALYDKIIEGNYKKAILEFADDFATYPFACLHAPIPTITTDTVWQGDKFKEVQDVRWAFERISPFDLFWTADSTDVQSGTAVFIRKRVPLHFLYEVRELKDSGYIKANIDEIINKAHEGGIPRNWTAWHVKNPEVATSELWQAGDTVEILIRYGRFSGYQLHEMGFTHLDDHKSYETKVTMLAGEIIQCQLNNNPKPNPRPVFTASFETRNGSIAGFGLGQKLLGVHQAYRAVIALAMYNLGLSSEPITEVEFTRISQYMPDEWIDNPVISAGQVIPADGDLQGNGSRAIKFTQIPSTLPDCLKLAEYMFRLTHVLSNIPEALHGQPVGTGANRTVRGLLAIQGNTLKPIHSAFMNLDMYVIEPMVMLLYKLLVMYDKDFEYSGDCKIHARGASGMIQREIDKQNAMENIQILGQLGGQVQPELLHRVITKLLQLSGVLEVGEEVQYQVPDKPVDINQGGEIQPPMRG